MAAQVRQSGTYELVEDRHGHHFLVLGPSRWYAWVEGQKSPLLVRTDSSHEKTREVQRGRYLFVDFRNDARFRDVPHLFLQKGAEYQELLLPNGLPTERDPQKRLVVSRYTLRAKELEDYLKATASAGARRARRGGPRPGA